MSGAHDEGQGGGASITVTRRRLPDGATRARPVVHQFSALAFYTAGSAQVEQRVRWQLRAGDVLIVPAGEPHRAVNAAGAEFWGLSLCGPCLPRAQATHLLAPFDRVRAGAAAVVHVPRRRRAYLSRLFRELQAEVSRSTKTAEDVRHSLLTLIVHEVEQATTGTPQDVPASGVVADALRVIERQCLGPLPLADIAAAVGRSPAHLTTMLRRATGRTAGEWITTFRMAQARHLLLHADLPVDEVAARVGYGDVTHFIRTFRKAHGATPAAWRHQAKGHDVVHATRATATQARRPRARQRS